MKLEYDLKADLVNKYLKIEILEQDERFLRKSNEDKIYEYKCKNGFIINSHFCVDFDEKKIYLKGIANNSIAYSKNFDTLEELFDYSKKVIEVLEEFEAYEPEVEKEESKKEYTLNDFVEEFILLFPNTQFKKETVETIKKEIDLKEVKNFVEKLVKILGE